MTTPSTTTIYSDAAQYLYLDQAYNFITKEENKGAIGVMGRSGFAAIATYITYPCPMLLGIGAAGLMPGATGIITQFADRILTTTWNNMTYEQKLVAIGLGTGVGITYSFVYPIPLVGQACSIVAMTFATKFWAETTLNNWKKAKTE